MDENEGFNLIDVSSENDSLIASVAGDVSSSTRLPPQSSGDLGADGVDRKDLGKGLGEQLQQPFEIAEPETLKKTGKYNLRKSLAWDSAFLESPGDLGANGVDGMDLSNGLDEQLQQPFETAEPVSLKKTGRYNLRKSLAWDSAFFESPGFLDAEDISTIIDGAEKGKLHLLPGIDEDVSRSTESISTLLSENLTLKSLEADLFEDIRASIQKSSKASGTSNAKRKAAAKETDKASKESEKPLSSSVKKVDVTSRNMTATNRTSMMQTGGMQGSGRILKKDSSIPLATQPDLRNGNSTSSLSQLPKVISKPGTMATITTKRASLGVSHTRIETSNSKVGIKGIQVPKAAGLTGPRRSVPKPASVSEGSSSVSSGASIREVGSFSSSSNNGCNSTFTKKVQKYPSTSLRTKTEVKPVTKASSSIPKASPKVPLRKKLTGKSGPPSSLMSSKISSNISPSSSISDWSSASSSTSTANQRRTPRTSINTNTLCSTKNERFSTRASFDTNNSRRSMDSDTPSILSSDVLSNGDMSDGNMDKFEEPAIPQDVKKTSVQSSVLSRSSLTKPSGLRMPSPKIGFFDGAKSVVRTPSGCRQSQSRLPTGLPKIGAPVRSPDGSLKKASPKLSQEPSRASMNVHSARRSALSPCISSELRISNKATGRQWPEMASTNIELEGLNFASSKPSQECVPGVSPEVHHEVDGSNCPKTEDVKFGKPDSAAKHATANAPEAGNDENLLLNI
ncbi:flocculation protein FLO11-like [Heracleum sosnowskyi]|uniref:Flocculation protein FLO11-like n=1 Tax=Heracleum sosnowskyi TaxID=360622 RepID=A0AAD8JBL3_9APIA|nr:flocculation protein FLO11-like [Heracleum sosnowskyi]